MGAVAVVVVGQRLAVDEVLEREQLAAVEVDGGSRRCRCPARRRRGRRRCRRPASPSRSPSSIGSSSRASVTPNDVCAESSAACTRPPASPWTRRSLLTRSRSPSAASIAHLLLGGGQRARRHDLEAGAHVHVPDGPLERLSRGSRWRPSPGRRSGGPRRHPACSRSCSRALSVTLSWSSSALGASAAAIAGQNMARIRVAAKRACQPADVHRLVSISVPRARDLRASPARLDVRNRGARGKAG